MHGYVEAMSLDANFKFLHVGSKMSLCWCHTKCHLVAMLSHYLTELKTAIQCLGIKPKAINK